MKINVISLKDSQKRRDEFIRWNADYIDFEFFDAVNGRTLELTDEIITQQAISVYPRGAIGCAMSHLALWDQCIESDEPMVIMEDDVFVSKDFRSHLTRVMDMLPDDWHILQLNYNCDSILAYWNTPYEIAVTFYTGRQFVDQDIVNFQQSDIYPGIARLKMSYGGGCYVISPSGAKIMKERCFPLTDRLMNIPLVGFNHAHSVDCMMCLTYQDINAYVCPIPFAMTRHLHVGYTSDAST